MRYQRIEIGKVWVLTYCRIHHLCLQGEGTGKGTRHQDRLVMDCRLRRKCIWEHVSPKLVSENWEHVTWFSFTEKYSTNYNTITFLLRLILPSCRLSHILLIVLLFRRNYQQVFNGCPLRIHCTASWIHPDTRDQHLLIAAEEGIYNLNLNELHETAIDQLYPRRTIWMYVIKDVLMSLSGKRIC